MALPISIISLTVLGYRCYKKERFLEALPLLITQFNSALIWGCQAAESIGFFTYNINGNTLMKPSFFSLRGLMTTGFLRDLIYLEPLNLFLYAWRFLRELEEEEENKTLKMCFRGFSLVSIVVLPLAFYCIVPSYIVENNRWYYYAFHVKPKQEQHYYFI